MAKFEIINPSDKAFIEGEPLVCAIATALFSNGAYSIQEVDGKYESPMFMFGGMDEWLKKNGIDDARKWLEEHNKEVVAALKTVKLSGERTSLNDFCKSAHKLAKRLEENPATLSK